MYEALKKYSTAGGGDHLLMTWANGNLDATGTDWADPACATIS